VSRHGALRDRIRVDVLSLSGAGTGCVVSVIVLLGNLQVPLQYQI